MAKLRDKREKRKHRGSGERVKKVASERRQWEPSTLNVPANVPLFYLKDAEPKRLDILDYVVGKGNPKADEGELYYERRFWIHRGFGADGKQAFVCTARTFGKKCAGCDYTAKQSKNPDADPDYIKSLMPKERQLLNVIDRKEPEKGVQVWETSWHNFGKLLELKIQNQDEDDNYHNFAQWEDGLTLKCDIEDDKTYGKSVASIEFKPRKDYDPEEIEEKVHCLDDLIKEPTYKEQQKIVQGMEEDSENEETEPTFKESDVKKIKNLTEKELKKFIITNELDEDILEMDTVEEMREAVVDEIKAALEEKPAKVGKKPKKKVEDEEEDEEEEETEESDDDDDDKEESDDDEEEEETEESDDDEDKEESDDDEEEESDDDEEEEEKPKKRGRPVKRK